MSMKSKVACEMTCERLCEGRGAFLWTFTFKDVLPYKVAVSKWSDLARDLVRNLGFFGVRVFELHLLGHGLHIHVLTCARFSVRSVRKLSNAHGFGRIHVKAIPESAVGYVAKYVSKQNKKEREEQGLVSFRLWQVIGKRFFPIKPSRVRDIEFHSQVCEVFNILRRGRKLSFSQAKGLWTVAQLVFFGILSLDMKNGLFVIPCSLVSDFWSVRESYSYSLYNPEFLFHPIEFDLGLPLS